MSKTTRNETNEFKKIKKVGPKYRNSKQSNIALSQVSGLVRKG